MSLGKDDPDLQVSPRRIVGPLKKEWVRGVAAGRLSSACWTEDTVWTWGTNTGQLGGSTGSLPKRRRADWVGYEKSANPVQILPRKVTQLSQPVIDISLSVSCPKLCFCEAAAETAGLCYGLPSRQSRRSMLPPRYNVQNQLFDSSNPIRCVSIPATSVHTQAIHQKGHLLR